MARSAFAAPPPILGWRPRFLLEHGNLRGPPHQRVLVRGHQSRPLRGLADEDLGGCRLAARAYGLGADLLISVLGAARGRAIFAALVILRQSAIAPRRRTLAIAPRRRALADHSSGIQRQRGLLVSAHGVPWGKSDISGCSTRLILAAPGGEGGGRSFEEEENAAMTTLSWPWLRGFTTLGPPATSEVARALKTPIISSRLRRSIGP